MPVHGDTLMNTQASTYVEERAKPQRVRKLAIVGLPNAGKTHVFNMLSGRYGIVANYLHTTVEIERACVHIGGQPFEIIDTPGLHSLFTELPDVVVQCIDANRLKQSLALTADLIRLRLPLVVCLNALDEARKNGMHIELKEMSRLLGVAVIGIASIHDRPIAALHEAVRDARPGSGGVTYSADIEQAISSLGSSITTSPPLKRTVSVLLLANDRSLPASIEKALGVDTARRLAREADEKRAAFKGNLERAIEAGRGKWIDEIAQAVLKHDPIVAPVGSSQVFGRLCRHPVWGFPILAFVVLLTYLLVVHVAGFIEGALSSFVVDPVVGYVTSRLPQGFWKEFLVGHYGILTQGLFNAFCTVLPILSVFFLMFGLLEDVGYIPNLCVLSKRLFEKAGLTGNAIMPLVLGLGCKTMATLTTRGLTSRKEKLIAVYLISFAIPCSAQLGIDMATLGRVGFKAFLIAYGTLVVVEIAAGVVLNRVLPLADPSEFIQELPPIRMPDLNALLKKTYYRLYWFLREAVPIFILAAVLLFAADLSGVLDAAKRILSPVVINWLGLPLDAVEVLILTFTRHEVAAGLVLNMVDRGALTYVQCIVMVVITTMFVPCFANIVAMCKELGVRTGMTIALAINISSFVLAGILNKILLLTIGR